MSDWKQAIINFQGPFRIKILLPFQWAPFLESSNSIALSFHIGLTNQWQISKMGRLFSVSFLEFEEAKFSFNFPWQSR